jgi:hypothetical protein
MVSAKNCLRARTCVHVHVSMQNMTWHRSRYGKCSGGKCGCGKKTKCTNANNKDSKRAKPTKFKWVPGDVPLTPGERHRAVGGLFKPKCGTLPLSVL